jgi:alpha-beta hydrolase superfamily lysophospholipase
VEHKFYTDARHEILNEINREEVYADIVNWLKKQM